MIFQYSQSPIAIDKPLSAAGGQGVGGGGVGVWVVAGVWVGLTSGQRSACGQPAASRLRVILGDTLSRLCTWIPSVV